MGKATSGLFGVFLVLLVAAIGAHVAYDTANAGEEFPTFLVALWSVVGAVLALTVISGGIWLFRFGRKWLRSVEILDDWRCTIWTAERRVGITLWVRDCTGAAGYDYARCQVHFGNEQIRSNSPDIGGAYMSQLATLRADANVYMVEFRWSDVDIADPSKARIYFEIKPAHWKGLSKHATKTITPRLIERTMTAPKSRIARIVAELGASADRAAQKKATSIEEDVKTLVQAYDDGTAVRTKLVQAMQQDVSDEESDGWMTAVDTWRRKTEERIAQVIDIEEVRRFTDLSGVTPAHIKGGTNRQQRYFQAIDCYIQRLDQIIQSYYESVQTA